MHIIQVHCEWDLGVPEFYISRAVAEKHMREAVNQFQEELEMTYEDAIEEGCITYEDVTVVEE